MLIIEEDNFEVIFGGDDPNENLIFGEGFDIQKFISKLPGLPWNKLKGGFKGEHHLFNSSFTGPGTRLDIRLNPDKTWKSFSKPKTRIDQLAYIHDLHYQQYKDKERRHLADKAMIVGINALKNLTPREKVEKAIVIPLLKNKVRFGLGLDE